MAAEGGGGVPRLDDIILFLRPTTESLYARYMPFSSVLSMLYCLLTGELSNPQGGHRLLTLWRTLRGTSRVGLIDAFTMEVVVAVLAV